MKSFSAKALSSFALLLALSACTKEDLESALKSNELTNEEVIQGLKEALTVGTDSSSTKLSEKDGYYMDLAVKIFLPQEAQVIYDRIGSIPGGTDLLEKTIQAVKRAAEDAASEAKPIFVDAITSMTIADGFDILKGNDSAATMYLKDKTYNPLRDAFQPKIKNSLSKPLIFDISAEESYSKLIDLYNTASLGGFLFDKITTNTLSEHVTRKGLDGLFLKVAEQEEKIRHNPLEQVTDLLKRVFGGNK